MDPESLPRETAPSSPSQLCSHIRAPAPRFQLQAPPHCTCVPGILRTDEPRARATARAPSDAPRGRERPLPSPEGTSLVPIFAYNPAVQAQMHTARGSWTAGEGPSAFRHLFPHLETSPTRLGQNSVSSKLLGAPRIDHTVVKSLKVGVRAGVCLLVRVHVGV